MPNPTIALTAICVIGAAAYAMYAYFTSSSQYEQPYYYEPEPRERYVPPPRRSPNRNNTNTNRNNRPRRRQHYNSNDICVICQDVIGEEFRNVLECSHIFHSICIREWFREYQNCPLCRSEVRS